MGFLDGIFGRRRAIPTPRTVAVDAQGPAVAQKPATTREAHEARSGFDGGRARAPTHTVAIGGKAVACSAEDAAAIASVARRDHTGLGALGAAALVVEDAFPYATQRIPHRGIEMDAPWDFSALVRLPPEQADVVRAALVRYAQPGFVQLPMDDKRAVLAALKPIAPAHLQIRLERWHLPRPAVTSTAKPITLALESETAHLGRIYRYYAPDPTGKLERVAMNDTLKQRLLDPSTRWALRPRSPVESRMPDDVWLASLRWKDLSPSAQHEYLKGVQATLDPHVKLHKITDVKQAPAGELAPATLQDTLKWERELRLQMAELITKSSYESLDAQRADRGWIADRFDGGFHLHAVTELSSAEDKARLGPKLTGMAALHDVALFAAAAASHATNYTHVFLEPWTAAFAEEVAASFKKGVIDADAILPHKFHFVGIRTGIYGQEDRLGIEVRGVQTGLTPKFDHATDRLVELVSGGGIERVPAPPWPGWDAGEKTVGKVFEDQARSHMKTLGERGVELVENAKLSFDDVMDLVVRGSGKKNGFAFAAPLWNFEALPGMTDDDKQAIAQARRGFTDKLLVVSEMLTLQIERGRDLDTLAPQVYDEVITAAMTFFQQARIDLRVERVLDDYAAPRAPTAEGQ